MAAPVTLAAPATLPLGMPLAKAEPGADDGDIERGELTFTVAQPAASASANPTQSDVLSPSPSASTPAAATPAPTPAPSAAPSAPASSTGDVLLPIVVGLILVGVVGAFVLRRSRGA